MEPVDVGDLLLGVDAHYTSGGTHCYYASTETHEHIILLDSDVSLSIAILLLL